MKKIAVLLCFVVLCAGASSPIDYEDYKAIRSAADKGDPTAMYNMGVMYDKGYKVSQNYTEALKWYRKSAAKNFPDAQYNIGVFYERGFGVRKSQ